MSDPQMIQKSGYGESLTDGPHFSWLGYSMLPEGLICHQWISFSSNCSGSEISFPLLFTEDLDFDLWPYLLSGKGGLGTIATS